MTTPEVTPTISAAGLKVPPPPPSLPISATKDHRTWDAAEWDALHRLLSEVRDACRSNKADEAYALITVCIENGVDTDGHIIAALKPFGYSRGHVGAMLTQGKRPYWRKGTDGRYALTADHPLVASATEKKADGANSGTQMA